MSSKAVASLPNSSTSYYKTQWKKSRIDIENVDELREANPKKVKKATAEEEYFTDSKSVEKINVIPKNVKNDDDNPNSQFESLVTEKLSDDSNVMLNKPTQSYISMIANAILQSQDNRLSLGSIYNWIEDNYPYFKKQTGQGWRNSVRHNLSLNDCFIKVGRCEDGKGNYWSIHPHNFEDFKRGEYKQQRRRRRGKRKDADNYYSFLTSSQLPFDPSTGVPWCFPYTEAERRAYRLDEAVMRQSVKNLEKLHQQAKLVGKNQVSLDRQQDYSTTRVFNSATTNLTAPAMSSYSSFSSPSPGWAYSCPNNYSYQPIEPMYHQHNHQPSMVNGPCHYCLCCYRQ